MPNFFFHLPIIVAQLNILSNFGSKLGKNWEEIGRKKYKQKQCNLSLHEIDGGSYNESELGNEKETRK